MLSEQNPKIKSPTVWRKFVSKTNKNYWIQDIPESYKEVVAKIMAYSFTKEEPLTKYSNASTYAKYLITANKFWRQCLDENVGLICFTTDEDGDWQIAGINCLCVTTYDEVYEELEEKCVNKIRRTMSYISKQGDAFGALKIDKYLNGFGLFVLPEFRGEGIGSELLKAREPLCKSLEIKATCAVFSSKFSQESAKKAGYKDLYDISYDELEKKDPDFKFPGIQEHTPNIKFMYIKYE